MPTASNASEQLKQARKDQVQSGDHPAVEARARKIKEDQAAEFHGPTTAMLDALQPFNIEGGEGRVHQMKARHAKQAAQEALKEAGQHLLNVADIRPVIKKHPWLALGGSAALGFAAAVALAPSEGKRAARRLRTLERALGAESSGVRAGRASRGTTGHLIRLGWRFAQPALLSLVTGAISGAATGAASGSEAGAESGSQAAGFGPEGPAGPGGGGLGEAPISDVT